MQVELAVVADYAATMEGGKLLIVGIFDQVNIQEFPGGVPRMVLALRIRVYGGEDADHRVKVALVDQDGQELLPPLRADFGVRREDANKDVSLNLILDMGNVMFQREGPHSFDVFLDGRFEERVSLKVVQIRPPGT